MISHRLEKPSILEIELISEGQLAQNVRGCLPLLVSKESCLSPDSAYRTTVLRILQRTHKNGVENDTLLLYSRQLERV